MNTKPLTHTDQLRTDVSNLTLNELCFDSDFFYDQPCYWGSRFGTHAVYCHCKKGPMKCRRTWFTSGQTKDEECEHFKENEEMEL